MDLEEAWESVYCTGNYIQGNQVKLIHSYDRLQFCEIQIFGQETGESI